MFDQINAPALLSALALRDALPIKTELDYFTADADAYGRAVDYMRAEGLLDDVVVKREALSSGAPYETFTVAGVEVCSPRGVTTLSDPTPIGKLAAARVTVRVGDAEVEIVGPNADAIAGAVFNAFPDASGSPLPSPDGSSSAEIIPFPERGRGRQVAPLTEGA